MFWLGLIVGALLMIVFVWALGYNILKELFK